MCGIAGIYNLDQTTPDLTQLQRMGDTLVHRGPDHVGYYTNEFGVGFCHRRLSIIDLSDRGNQPMASEDKSIWLVYNGEIYNYIEIREKLIKKGYKFKSKSDTEVIIKAYQEFGIDCINQFNGMFSFSLWDSNSRRFFAARDRIGIKPFYYYFDGKTFVFASEIKSVLKHRAVIKEQNENAITNFLLFDHQIDDQTWFKNIYSLNPGSYLVIEKKRLSFKKYWDIEYNINYTRTYKSFKDELRETIINSVKSHWQSDVPVGAHLSGGVDSSSIVSIASTYLTTGLHTFSSAFNLGRQFDERKEIEVVAKKFRTKHHQISIHPNDFEKNLSKILYHLDEPVVGPAILPMFRISELVKHTGIKVVNGGQGVDEMFGGYPPYFSLAVRNIFSNFRRESFPVSELCYVPLYLKKGGTINRFFGKFKKLQRQDSWIRGQNILEKQIEGFKKLQNGTSELSPFEKSSYTSMRYYLPALLQQEDRMSMAWSIESRVPMLDSRIIDLSLQIPSWYKVSKGMSKSIFREAMRGIVPDQILDNKIKRGYPTPISIWFATDLYNYTYDLFNSKKMMSGKYINNKVLLEILKNQRNDTSKNISFPIWQALVLEMWFKINFSE